VTEGSGSEIHDFQFEDPDPKLLISDPEHCRIRIDFNTDQDPAFEVDTDPDPAPDPGFFITN